MDSSFCGKANSKFWSERDYQKSAFQFEVLLYSVLCNTFRASAVNSKKNCPNLYPRFDNTSNFLVGRGQNSIVFACCIWRYPDWTLFSEQCAIASSVRFLDFANEFQLTHRWLGFCEGTLFWCEKPSKLLITFNSGGCGIYELLTPYFSIRVKPIDKRLKFIETLKWHLER